MAVTPYSVLERINLAVAGKLDEVGRLILESTLWRTSKPPRTTAGSRGWSASTEAPRRHS
jgi:hypothetical protein